MVDTVHQQTPVGKARQNVVKGAVQKLGLGALPEADQKRVMETMRESIYFEPKLAGESMKDYPFLAVGGFDASVGDLDSPKPVFFEYNLGTPSGLSNNIQLLDILRQHCETVGRNFDEITRSTSMNIFLVEDGADPEKASAKARGATPYETFARDNFVGTAAQIRDQIAQLSELGINYVITSFPRVAYDHTMLHQFASEVMPAFA